MENKKGYLPSGQFMATAVAFVVVAGLFFVAYHFPKELNVSYTSPETELQATAIKNLAAATADKDSDQDGLKDWEETIFKTDPNKTDSDGDGTKDGDEVKEGRDPAKKGPNDKLPTNSDPSNSLGGSASSQENLSATDKFARQFFSAYTQAKQAGGGKISSASESQIIASALSQQDLGTNARQYSEGELNVSYNTSETALRAYINSLGLIQKNHTYDPTKDTELVIFNRAMHDNKESELAQLTPIINRYDSLKQELLKIPVPKDLVQQHLLYLNAISIIVADVQAMQNAFKDPVRAIAALAEYTKVVPTIPKLHENFAQYYGSKNITFNQNDDAYLFLNVYR